MGKSLADLLEFVSASAVAKRRPRALILATRLYPSADALGIKKSEFRVYQAASLSYTLNPNQQAPYEAFVSAGVGPRRNSLGSQFRVQDSGCRVQGSGFRSRVQDSRFRVQGSELRVEG